MPDKIRYLSSVYHTMPRRQANIKLYAKEKLKYSYSEVSDGLDHCTKLLQIEEYIDRIYLFSHHELRVHIKLAF